MEDCGRLDLKDIYDRFLSEMELSSSKVIIDYLPSLRYNKYKFIETISAVPYSSDQLKVLDIGTSISTLFLRKVFPDYEIATIDIDNRLEKECTKRGIIFKQVDLTEDTIPFKDYNFDIIIFSEVFEHLFIHPSKIFGELYRVLTKDGTLIFATMNIAMLYKRIKCLFGKPTNAFPIAEVIERHLHVREYTMQECLDILRDTNFVIEKSRYSACWDKLDIELQKFGQKYVIPILIYVCIVKAIPSFRGDIFIMCKK